MNTSHNVYEIFVLKTCRREFSMKGSIIPKTKEKKSPHICKSIAETPRFFKRNLFTRTTYVLNGMVAFFL